jgi:hypothetical protein
LLEAKIAAHPLEPDQRHPPRASTESRRTKVAEGRTR